VADRLRIATWNLERPSARPGRRRPRQLERLSAVDADVWVLTETRVTFSPAPGYHGLHTPPHPPRRPDEDERWVGIWSRWPLVPTEVPPDPSGAVSAIVDRPDGPFVVYGTVLPWANERGDDGRARMWEVHHAEVVRQSTDWRDLRARLPELPLLVAGDFNQDRDGSGWYGSRVGRELLTQGLAEASLVCVTSEDVVAAGKLDRNHLVDHVAISTDMLRDHDVDVHCWEPTDPEGVALSDHPTVAVDLTRR
jgi:endonuclease/exonuclease/phosphatase family metal-dependent hydrolase